MEWQKKDRVWENINTQLFLKSYCKEEYNNVTEDEMLDNQQQEDTQGDSTPPTTENWKEKAAEMHQNMADMLGDRLFDSIETKDKNLFLRKLGYALYGSPKKFTNNDDIGYDEDKMKSIGAVAEAIVQLQGTRKDRILCHTIFVILFVEGQPLIPVPVFRVPKPGQEVNETCPVIFVDREHRIYNSWKAFLEENNLPKCWISFPVNGVYKNSKDGNVNISCCQSPACSIASETLEVLDITSTAATVGATVVGLASLVVPVAGPLMLAATVAGGTTGIYGMGRSIAGLVDRGCHGQSIAPTDPEARGHWISAAGSALNFASAGALKAVSQAARSGQVASNAVLLTTDCLQVSSLVMNGVGIANHGYHLYIKKQSGENPTALDYFQFASSVLFFSNSIININTAKTIFKQEQHSHIKQHRNALRSNRHRRQFDRLSRNTRKGMRATEGRAKVIRSINKIENNNDFYAGVARVSKQYKFYKAKIKFTENGQIRINGRAVMHPMELAQLQKSDRLMILSATKDLHKGVITNKEFTNRLNRIFLKNNLEFNNDRACDVRNICTAFGCKDLFKSIFRNGMEMYLCKPEVLKMFYSLIMHTDYKIVFATAAEIARRMNWETAEKTLKFMEFACPYIFRLYNEFQDAYDTCMQEEIPLSTVFHCIMMNVYSSYRAVQNLRAEYERFRNSGYEDPEDYIESIPLNESCPQNMPMNAPKFIIYANLFYSVYIEIQSAICNIQQIRHSVNSGRLNEEFVKSLGKLLGNIMGTYRTGKMFVEMYHQNPSTNQRESSPILKCALFCRLAAVIAIDLGYTNLGEFFKFIHFMLQRLLSEYGHSTEDLQVLEIKIRDHYENSQNLWELQSHFNRESQKSL